MKLLFFALCLTSLTSLANETIPAVPCGGGSDSNCRNEGDNDLSNIPTTSHHDCRDVENVDCMNGIHKIKKINCIILDKDDKIIDCNGKIYKVVPTAGTN